MEVKNIILQNLLEAGPTGDKAASGVAGAKGSLDKVKERLRKLDIHSLPDLDNINTIEQLAIEPFKLTFVLQDLEDKQEEFKLPKPLTFEGVLARVVKDDKYPLVLEIKGEESNFKMAFVDKDELTTRLPGTKKPIMALHTEEGKTSKFYSIVGDSEFRKYIISESGAEVKQGEETEGQEGEGGKEGEEGGKEGKEGKEGEEGKGSDKKGNFYNGKDLKEVNTKLNDVKEKARFFQIIKNYKDDQEFQDMFLDAFISFTDKAITINKKPIAKSLKDFKNNQLLEDEEEKKKPGFEFTGSMSGMKRKLLVVKRNLQNFMFDVFSLFAKLNKQGRDSKTFQLIKEFYKKLYIITREGASNTGDKQKRKQLFKKLYGTFVNFVVAMVKLPVMVKGKKGKEEKEGKEVKVKNQPKATLGTVESLINQIAKTLLKEEGEEEQVAPEENQEEQQEQNEFVIEAQIYVKDISLGTKAKVRKGQDKIKYTEKVTGDEQQDDQQDASKWDGTVYSLPNQPKTGFNVKVKLDLIPESNLNDEQKTVFKEIQNAIRTSNYNGPGFSKIRKSAKDTNGTVFIVTFNIGGKPVAMVCKTTKKAVDLRKNTEIEIGPKMGDSEVFTKATLAKIQIITN